MVKKILFVCSQNKLRSPTAEQIFSEITGLEVLSAGTNNDAVTPLSSELIEWADKIFVMEGLHRAKLQKRFRHSLNGKKVICLDIPDNFTYMDPELITLLKKKVARFLA
ncbi:MAG: low molecular weight protein tyrosine phosphatase family protein [Arenimonas sp.]